MSEGRTDDLHTVMASIAATTGIRRHRLARDYIYRPQPIPYPESPVFCDSWTNPQGEGMINTMSETVVLSMDPMKAAVVMRSSYNAFFIKRMESEIPSNQRRWDAVEKVWIFHPDALPKLKQLVPEFYAGIKVVGVQKQVPATKFDLLMHKLTPKDKRDIYILLAKRYHPDCNGDRETMSLINEVFEK